MSKTIHLFSCLWQNHTRICVHNIYIHQLRNYQWQMSFCIWMVKSQSRRAFTIHIWAPITTGDACFAECNCTRQRRLCTRQSLCRVLHSAKSCLHISSRQRLLCRVPHVGHLAKDFPSATTALGKEKPPWWPGHGDGPFAECHASALGKEMCFLF